MNFNLSTVYGYLPISGELAREMYERAIGPVHGPPVPMPWRMWFELGGRPAGPYRRTS